MENHVKLLAIFHLIWGGIGLLTILIVFTLFVGGFTLLRIAEGDPVPFWLAGGFGTVLLVIAAVVAVPSLLAGYGLLKRRIWARILTIILSIIALFEFSLGTILGVYGLYVLLHGESSRIFAPGSYPPMHSTQ